LSESGDAPRGHSKPSWALRMLIVTYRVLSANRSPACRFTPSCSEYALESLDRFGARRGLPLALRRLGRCRPGGPFGFDPVPELPLGRDGATDAERGGGR